MDKNTVAMESSTRRTIGFGPPKRKIESEASMMDALMKMYVDLCKKETQLSERPVPTTSVTVIEHMQLSKLYVLIEQQQKSSQAITPLLT